MGLKVNITLAKFLTLATAITLIIGCSAGVKKEDSEASSPSSSPSPAPSNPPFSNPELDNSKLTATLSGSINNLVHSTLTLKLNETETVVINAGQTNFQFSTLLNVGSNYSITISSQPTSPSISCTLINNTGIVVAPGSISNVLINCPALQSLSLSAPTYNPITGTDNQLNVTALFEGGLIKSVSNFGIWTSSNTTVGKVNSSGLFSALSAGNTDVGFTFGGMSLTKTFNVSSLTLNSIAISPTSLNLPIDSQQSITATGFYSDNTNRDITNSVTWISSNPTIATISAVGLVKGISAGSTNISATLGTITYSVPINVTSSTLVGIDVTPAFIAGTIGSSQAVNVIARYANGTTLDVTNLATLTSSDTNLASIYGNTISLVASGNTSIVATYSGQNINIPVNISGKTISRLTISQNSITMPVNAMATISLTATYSDNSTEDITEKADWFSIDPSILTANNLIGKKGQLKSLSLGNTSITASYAGQSVSANLNVINMTVSSLRLNPGSLLIPKGINLNYKAYATFSNGIEYEVTPFAVWTSSSPSIVSISNAINNEGAAQNLYTGASYAGTTITGSYAGQSTSSLIKINPSTLSSIVISPASITMNTFQTTSLRALGQFVDGGLTDLSSLVTWTSSDPSVTSVSNYDFTRGILSALNQGVSTVSASLGSVIGNRSVTIDNSQVKNILVEGMGLKGDYYSNKTLTTSGYAGSRIDSTINYNWATGLAPLGVGDTFSIRWTGKLLAVYSETYTFCTKSDDGVRLWVNGVQVINNWTDHAVTENCSTISLSGGQKYNIQLEFYENGGYAQIELYWQSPSQVKQIVPRKYLFDQ